MENSSSLNQQRKQLYHEVSTLKNYRDYCFNQSMLKIAEIKNDYAEKYFSLDGEYANRSFDERFHYILHYLVSFLLVIVFTFYFWLGCGCQRK
jgi:hypothetical protein